MEREIKFRGLRKNGTDRNGSKWLFGDFSHRDWLSGTFGNNKVQVYVFPFDDVISCEEDYEVIPETVGQLTGLYDRNKKAIYEGDILQFSDREEWYSNTIMFQDKSVLDDLEKFPYERRTVYMPDCYEWILSSEIQEWWEVIGNIFDNKDLLTKK